MTTMTELKHILIRSRVTLIEDATGAVALGVMLIVALHLPSLT